MVGHGGHATTMVALAHDLPLLVIPMDAMTDQPFIGKAIQRAGAGRTMGRKSSPEKIRAAIEELLADGPHRAAAARLGAVVRALPGATTGADLVEDVLSAELRRQVAPRLDPDESRPSQPASTSSSSRSSSAVSSGAPSSAQADCTRSVPLLGRP